MLPIDVTYNRGGQSAAPVPNFGCTTKLFMKNLCMQLPKININYVCKKKGKKNFPARNAIF